MRDDLWNVSQVVLLFHATPTRRSFQRADDSGTGQEASHWFFVTALIRFLPRIAEAETTPPNRAPVTPSEVTS